MFHYRLKEHAIAPHQGIFRRQLTVWEGVALVLSGTIGAGVLAIPYAVSRVGLGIGFLYIVTIGLLMMTLNLLLGEIAARTKGDLQLAGLAKKYLGGWGEFFMTILMYSMSIGGLVVYIIGEGTTLAALFGGSSAVWSTIFFLCGTFLIAVGLRTLKAVELVLTGAIFVVVLLIASFSIPHITLENVEHTNLAALLLPYGVILFAFHGAASIPEAHALLKNKEKSFKQVIILSSVITMVLYAIFTGVTVGVMGRETTEIATIGLGNIVGPYMHVLGNIFAVLAMGTSFLMVGLSLRDSLQWDFRFSAVNATLLVCLIPFTIFALGLRQFIAALDIVGGVFGSLELLLIMLIYRQARKHGDIAPKSFFFEKPLVFIFLLTLAFSIGGLYSISKFF